MASNCIDCSSVVVCDGLVEPVLACLFITANRGRCDFSVFEDKVSGVVYVD